MSVKNFGIIDGINHVSYVSLAGKQDTYSIDVTLPSGEWLKISINGYEFSKIMEEVDRIDKN